MFFKKTFSFPYKKSANPQPACRQTGPLIRELLQVFQDLFAIRFHFTIKISDHLTVLVQ